MRLKTHTLRNGDTLTVETEIDHDGRITKADVVIEVLETKKKHTVLRVSIGKVVSSA